MLGGAPFPVPHLTLCLQCAPGYSGQNCSQEPDACQSQPCHNHGTCTPKPGGFHCVCPPGFVGLRCEGAVNQCLDQRCHPRGTAACHSLANALSCQCLPGHTGEASDRAEVGCGTAELTVKTQGQSPPSSRPSRLVHPHSLAQDMPQDPFAYAARAGPSPGNEPERRQRPKQCVTPNPIPTPGQWCEVEIDPCQSQPCSQGGSCEATAGPPPGFTCRCHKVSGCTAGCSVSPHHHQVRKSELRP